MKRFFLAGLAAGMIIAGVSGMAHALPVLWETNGHYYDAISYPSGITWTDAKQVAANSTFLGVNGHLATITSMDENIFIANSFGSNTIYTYFIGGFQPADSPEPSGNWQWITGEPWSFTNWAPGEPNNFYSGGGSIPLPYGITEEVLHLFGVNSQWNDVPLASSWYGLISEYEPSAVPEPSTFLLLGAGLGVFVLWRQRNK